MRLFKNWDKEEKASAVRILGLVMAALTVFMLIASVSYLFHWKQDMSLLAGADASDAGQPVGNAAGRLGFRTGYLLVCELFGMGSFCLLLILGAVTVRLLLHRWRRSLVKTALIALFGAFISSLLFAYCGRLAGLDDIFGGGLGGRCGALTRPVRHHRDRILHRHTHRGLPLLLVQTLQLLVRLSRRRRRKEGARTQARREGNGQRKQGARGKRTREAGRTRRLHGRG